MGLRDWVDRYVVSIPPGRPAPGAGPIDVTQPLESGPQVSALAATVEEAPIKAMSGIDVAFEKIYEAARIVVPAHKFTVEKIGEMLAHPKLAALAPEGKAAAVLVALEAQGVKIEEVIEDAIKKDKALDLFEKVQVENLKRSLKQKMDESEALSTKIEANRKACTELEGQVAAWVKKKQELEARLYTVIGHFTTQNPITATNLSKKQPVRAAAAASGASVTVTDLTGSLDEPK